MGQRTRLRLESAYQQFVQQLIVLVQVSVRVYTKRGCSASTDNSTQLRRLDSVLFMLEP
eukprot:SAG31_NODE_77_length_27533_cov_47.448859_2_plen_59_part_00